MRGNLTYRRILGISAPIMVGSAAQNVITLTDSIFLYHVSDLDFAAIGFVGVYYLIVAAIGYGFSRGGQILIARRYGERNEPEAGRTFYSILYFEIALAILLFLIVYFGSGWIFQFFLSSEEVMQKSLDYINYRSWGIFPSFIGVAIIAFYTGISRTRPILYDTLILILVNIFLNYSLIFGKFSLPEMGIAGAGLASTIAEVVALFVFILYMFFDKRLKRYLLLRIPQLDMKLIKDNFSISSPIVAQAVVGLGSWFFFFGIIENLGEHALAVANLGRIVYLTLSIPTWGFAVGVNTMVSSFIGQGRSDEVMAVIWKTIRICVITTLILAIPVLLFPKYVWYPLLGSEDMELFTDAQPIFYILFIILVLFSIGAIYFNGLVGTGATYSGLKIQTLCVVFYVIIVFVGVNYLHIGLYAAWALEILYWLPMILIVHWYIKRSSWRRLEI